MQQKKPSLVPYAKNTGEEKHQQQHEKHRLWKQVPTKQPLHHQHSNNCSMDQNLTNTQTQDYQHKLINNQYRKISQNLEQDNDNNILSPIRKRKQKQRCPTISNFLKQLQIQNKTSLKDFQKTLNQSQIMSILDVKYSEQFSQDKQIHNLRRIKKSFIADKKYHLSLLLCTLKQIYEPIRQSVHDFIKKSSQQLGNLSEHTKKMITKYQLQLSQKNLQIRHLELKSRQLRLTNSESTYHFESQINLLTNNNKTLEQKIKQISSSCCQLQSRCKQYHQQNISIKKYNIELNELLLKYHKKIQDLECKLQQSKSYNQLTLSKQIQKVSSKYENQLKQQQQNYKLKLQNTNIKLSNLLKQQHLSASTYRVKHSLSNTLLQNNINNISKISDRLSNNSINNSYIQQFTPNNNSNVSFNNNNSNNISNININNNRSIKNNDNNMNINKFKQSITSYTIHQLQQNNTHQAEDRNNMCMRATVGGTTASSIQQFMKDNINIDNNVINNNNKNNVKNYNNDMKINVITNIPLQKKDSDEHKSTSPKRFERTARANINTSNNANTPKNINNNNSNITNKVQTPINNIPNININTNINTKTTTKVSVNTPTNNINTNNMYKSNQIQKNSINQCKSATNLNNNMLNSINTPKNQNNNNNKIINDILNNYTPKYKNCNILEKQQFTSNTHGKNMKNIVQIDRKLRETIN